MITLSPAAVIRPPRVVTVAGKKRVIAITLVMIAIADQIEICIIENHGGNSTSEEGGQEKGGLGGRRQILGNRLAGGPQGPGPGNPPAGSLPFQGLPGKRGDKQDPDRIQALTREQVLHRNQHHLLLREKEEDVEGNRRRTVNQVGKGRRWQGGKRSCSSPGLWSIRVRFESF